MSNYTKTTNFATKDNLSPGNPLKIVKGTEIDTEFNNISTAVATKTDNSAAAITGGTITGITDLAVADGGTGASTAAGALNNLLPSQTSNANKYLQTDGTNATWDTVSLSTADITGTLGVANGGTGVTSSTGTGNVVLSNSPTLVTPTLGTPASGTATNLTGLPISTGVSGLGTGVATFLATPTAANLASAVTDETGSGALVFATSPTLVTPVLGTPASATLTNATGLPISTGVSGLGTGVATFLGTPSSANLASAVTDETGSGALVFATSPTLVTPALGTPSALVGTNITGTASGLTAGNVTTNANLTGAVTSVGNATSLGSFTSAQLATALTDETGSGANVFATSPTLVTPILGTPTSATLTNATGLPLSTGVTGTLPIANGGSGQTTATAAFNALAPSQTSNSGKYLTTDGTNSSWATVSSGTPGGSTTQVQYNNAGAFGGITGATTNGTALTLVAPVLGTPASATLTNATGLPLSTGVTGTLPVANGGTGQTTYTDGQLLIGNSTGNTLTKATLTAGTNVTITNAAGAITIAASGGGASAATPTALGTVYGKTDASTLTFLGYQAGNANTTGTYNVAIGNNALLSNTSGQQSIAIGYGAVDANTTGNHAVGIGQNALGSNTTADDNTAVGWNSTAANTTGASNTALGAYSLYSNTTASNNTAIGYQAAYTNTTGASNTAVGYQSLYANTTGDISVAVGMNALKAQTTATQNTAMGYGAGAKLTSSSYNVAIGTSALSNMVNGANQNVAIGQNALLSYVNTSVSEGGAVAVGAAALQNCTTGGSNIAVGRNAGLSITTGALNTIIGDRAGESANSNYGVYLGSFCGIYTTGDYNTFIGWQAGHNTTSTTTGSSNIYIGAASRGSAATNSSEIVIGVSANGKGSSTGFINPNSGGVYQGNNSSSWSTTSDQRLKKNIADNNDGLDKINSIRVRNFEYRLPEEVDTELSPNDAIKKSGVQLGVIAQELQAVLPECVKQESTGVLSVDTDNLTWYLINAVKQLKAEIDQLKGNV